LAEAAAPRLRRASSPDAPRSLYVSVYVGVGVQEAGKDENVEGGRRAVFSGHHPVASMSRFLIILGLVILITGLLWPWLSKLGLGRLPGDIVIERENTRIYIPLMTSLIASVVLSLLLWVLNR